MVAKVGGRRSIAEQRRKATYIYLLFIYFQYCCHVEGVDEGSTVLWTTLCVFVSTS